MQINQLANKVEQIASAWESFKSINDRRLSEIENKGKADLLTVDQLNRINHAIDDQKFRLNKLEVMVSRPANISSVNIEDNPHKAAFLNYLRKGIDIDLLKYESKSLSSAIESDGGYLVVHTLSKQIIKKLTANSPMRQIASIEKISTDSLDLIEDLDNFEAGWINETDARADTMSGKINKKRIFVHEMYAQPKATQKLIDDASIDIGKWIVEKISDSFAQIENYSFIHGDEKNKPKGILSYKNGTEWNQIEQINSGKPGEITADSIIRLYYLLHSDYAAKAKFMIHRNSLQQIRMLKCPTTEQYLWAPGLAVGTEDTLLGAEVVESSDMPIPAENSLSIAIADFERAYKIVDRQDIRVLRDPFTEKPFVKFYATKRVGGEIVNFDAIKLLKLV
jgi:HK97 family phage major capsid protein